MVTGLQSPMARRILIVDDDAASRSGLETLLSSWGYETETAADGEEALAKVMAFHPAVVVTVVQRTHPAGGLTTPGGAV